jgi:hypothetical protein
VANRDIGEAQDHGNDVRRPADRIHRHRPDLVEKLGTGGHSANWRKTPSVRRTAWRLVPGSRWSADSAVPNEKNREKPTPRTTKALVDLAIYQGLQMVAGVGFEPTTFGL